MHIGKSKAAVERSDGVQSGTEGRRGMRLSLPTRQDMKVQGVCQRGTHAYMVRHLF